MFSACLFSAHADWSKTVGWFMARYLFIYLFFWQGWAPLCGRPRYFPFPFKFKSRRARCQCFSLSFTLVIFITSRVQEILLRANTFQLWSLTHSPTHSFGDAKRGGVWGELGTEWMLCREKKQTKSIRSLHLACTFSKRRQVFWLMF